MELIFKGTEVVFDLSEPLVFEFFGRCNHQGSQSCQANTLHLCVNLIFYFFWDDIFSHNLQQEGGGKKNNPVPLKGAEDYAIHRV